MCTELTTAGTVRSEGVTVEGNLESKGVREVVGCRDTPHIKLDFDMLLYRAGSMPPCARAPTNKMRARHFAHTRTKLEACTYTHLTRNQTQNEAEF